MKKLPPLSGLLLAALGFHPAPLAHADEVTEWNKILFEAAQVPPATSPLVITRTAAVVHAAIFDAVNGIERRYTHIRVAPAAERGASIRAAAVQAAYASLIRLYPAQKPTFDARRATAMSAIVRGPGGDDIIPIARGVEWGQIVADAIWTWRSTDGFTPAPPAFLGGLAAGQWRPTPAGFAPGAAPQFAYLTPWAIQTPSQFRPAGPPTLTSTRYTTDFNETRWMGSTGASARTADQTLACLFWNTSTASFLWNHVALSLSAKRHLTLSANARLFALINIAAADGAIACWDAKYTYLFWRPVTAIPLAATDGNPDTNQDLTWTPLLSTPAHPEYPSGHSTVSSAAVAVLADYFGDQTSFGVISDVMPGVVRSFTSFSAALDEVANARIYGGIHFRSACVDGQAAGTAVGSYALQHSLLPLHGNNTGQVRD
jgi:membrane-associated phospholipid phosphatase